LPGTGNPNETRAASSCCFGAAHVQKAPAPEASGHLTGEDGILEASMSDGNRQEKVMRTPTVSLCRQSDMCPAIIISMQRPPPLPWRPQKARVQRAFFCDFRMQPETCLAGLAGKFEPVHRQVTGE